MQPGKNMGKKTTMIQVHHDFIAGGLGGRAPGHRRIGSASVPISSGNHQATSGVGDNRHHRLGEGAAAPTPSRFRSHGSACPSPDVGSGVLAELAQQLGAAHSRGPTDVEMFDDRDCFANVPQRLIPTSR